MFHYFGYGSNLSVISLRAKGVHPLSSEPAILEGWRLTFDIPDFFPIEGGTGNIQPATDDAVHGVLHACRDADLARLDQLEALGVTYRRVETSVTTYGGRRVRAYAYVGIPDILDARCRPSERYRNILVAGATDMRLDPRYVARLRAMPTHPRPERGPFVPSEDGRDHDADEIASRRELVVLAGHVFDTSHARPEHTYLRGLLGGRDATLLFLRRMDTSDGHEQLETVRRGVFTPAQRRYLDGYLHEFAREYRWVGRVRSDDDAQRVPEITKPAAQRPRVKRASDAPKRASWVPTHALTSRPPGTLVIPSRAVLDESDRDYETLGHENRGFLSDLHGFMPREQPATSMPASHRAWDEVAAQLPALYRTLKLRREIDALPILDASAEHLADEHLLRASMVLAMLSHAYHYVEAHPPGRHPDALTRPWAQVRERLGRGPAVLSYLDLIVYNWRFVDPEAADPMRVDNLRLLVPTVDTKEERVFYLTQTEILAHTAPIVSAVVRAQEAVVTDDREALECALATILTSLQRVVRESLLHIDPNPRGRTHVDPVIWAKGVAPFAVPMQEGVQGPSGTSSPIFNTLDVFFGRKRYETFLGKEIHALRTTYPPLWRAFLAALQEISVPGYVATRGDANLRGLLQDVVAEYAGPNGFLGRHRMKVYGYLELAFKVGRSVTIGGFKGMFRDRTWDQVDGELEKAREERVQSFPATVHRAKAARVLPSDPDAAGGVHTVVLDVRGTGVRFEAGDRCGVLPEHAHSLIARTLRALRATGDEEMPLTPEWREHLAMRPDVDAGDTLRLADMLRFGAIRPVGPRLAEGLHARTQHPLLEHAITSGTTSRWELWDLLELLATSGFDPSRLVRDPATGEPSAALAKLLPPEAFRMYSISSVMGSAGGGHADELHLTIGRVAYRTRTTEGGPEIERRGTCSSFLARAASRDEPIAIVIQHPARFGLPRSARTPIVMIAGGTGLSPFRGFLVERGRQLAAGPAWLFLGMRERAHFAYDDELAPHLESGTLELRVAISREDVDARVVKDGGRARIEWRDGTRKRVPDLLLDPETSARLDALVRSAAEGGAGAHVYVCGRTAFARSALDALEQVFRRHARTDDPATEARDRIAEIVAEGRLAIEVFSGDREQDALPPIDASELARHNDETHGHWMAIEGRVYDMTQFIREHPGGRHILQAYAGLDATAGYARSHAGRTEIHAAREMYAIGRLRALDLGGVIATVHGNGKSRRASLSVAHGAWVSLLFLLVEMQNALRHDHALQHGETTRDEPLRPRSPYKLQHAVETHHRFLCSYVDALCAESIPHVSAVTQAFFAPEDDPFVMRGEVTALLASDEARFVDGLVPALFESVTRVIAEDDEWGEPGPERRRLTHAIDVLERADAALLASLKHIARDAVRAYEAHEKHVIERDGARVQSACRRMVDELRRYHRSIAQRLGQSSGWVAHPPARRASEVESTMTTMHANPHWTLEIDGVGRFLVLRRTPVPFETIEEVLHSNDDVISHFQLQHRQWGIVVDMRQAPRRNDPDFENAMRRLRERIGESFARVALVLSSAAGVLQVNRIARDEGASTFATLDESAAVRFARGLG
ncbi:cytochrome b5 domain-containing protein [Sandaracinus amylolyticus]|uniref:Sulfite reductase [NADPH] flavoprotein alpha-component n=1 Tax=Sandaracinus amylolyticus TaxID=927083 RepID=A0A0F6W7C5_9BACT|nr:cytochrome b5 domain-containing protein [Sandaracinus amylolyticus]AKF09356.1 Sulfite reductase [NADPH] flavoprotein alpha-component [Sandaracinus amylolyticus]